MSKITDIEEQTVSISSDDSDDDMHTKGLQRADTARTGDSRTQRMFVVWTVINTLATIGIVRARSEPAVESAPALTSVRRSSPTKPSSRTRPSSTHRRRSRLSTLCARR